MAEAAETPEFVMTNAGSGGLLRQIATGKTGPNQTCSQGVPGSIPGRPTSQPPQPLMTTATACKGPSLNRIAISGTAWLELS